MRERLVEWQWSLYADAHRDRANLLIHIATVPLFMVGTVLVLSSPLVSAWSALAGLGAMAAAVAAEGWGHGREGVPPVPFEGPMDAASRLFVEHWLTFPRFVFSGGYARAWAAAQRK